MGFGGLTSAEKLQKHLASKNRTLAPGPTAAARTATASTIANTPTPPDAGAEASSAALAGKLAADKARKKGAAAGFGNLPGATLMGRNAPAARLIPKTLMGY